MYNSVNVDEGSKQILVRTPAPPPFILLLLGVPSCPHNPFFSLVLGMVTDGP